MLLPPRRYYMVGFYNSAKVLVFFGFTFITAVWSLTWNLAVASLARTPTVAVAFQVG